MGEVVAWCQPSTLHVKNGGSDWSVSHRIVSRTHPFQLLHYSPYSRGDTREVQVQFLVPVFIRSKTLGRESILTHLLAQAIHERTTQGKALRLKMSRPGGTPRGG